LLDLHSHGNPNPKPSTETGENTVTIQPEHIEGAPIWECPCVECLHLDYEASDDGHLPPFYEWARAERADRTLSEALDAAHLTAITLKRAELQQERGY